MFRDVLDMFSNASLFKIDISLSTYRLNSSIDCLFIMYFVMIEDI